MMILGSGQNIWKPPMQPAGLPKVIGQIQSAELQKVVGQINAAFDGKKNQDTVEFSQKAQELIQAEQAKGAEETQKKESPRGYQKYPREITEEQWAENAIYEQRDGIKTLSDFLDYAKAKLEYTVSKINELENFLNGTGTHSNPHMTKKLAEAYLHNYKQSILYDYTSANGYDTNVNLCKAHLFFSNEYDELSGGAASKVIENQLESITAESLGLANLSSDPEEIMEALENASKILQGITEKLESAFSVLTDGKPFDRPARSTSIFNGNSNFDFFTSQMEKPYKIADRPLHFHGPTLSL